MPRESVDQAVAHGQSFDELSAARRGSTENDPLLLTMSSDEVSNDNKQQIKFETIVSGEPTVTESYVDDACTVVSPVVESQGFVCRVYRRRWIGVAAISLLNFMSAFR